MCIPCRLHVFHEVCRVNHHSRSWVNSSLQVLSGTLVSRRGDLDSAWWVVLSYLAAVNPGQPLHTTPDQVSNDPHHTQSSID